MLKLRLARLARDTRGAPILEFALALPMLVILAAGGYEFGRAFWHHHVATKSVRDATRYLSRVPNPLSATFQDHARNLVLRGTLDSSAPMLLPDWQRDPTLVNISAGLNTVDNSGGTFRGPDGSTADVQVIWLTATVLYPGTGLLSLVGLGSGLTLTIHHEERHIGE